MLAPERVRIDKSSRVQLDLYVEYENLYAADIADLITFVDSVYGIVARNAPRWDSYPQLSELSEELEILSAHTGDSIRVKLGPVEFEYDGGLGSPMAIAAVFLTGALVAAGQTFMEVDKFLFERDQRKERRAQAMQMAELEIEKKRLEIRALKRSETEEILINFDMQALALRIAGERSNMSYELAIDEFIEACDGFEVTGRLGWQLIVLDEPLND